MIPVLAPAEMKTLDEANSDRLDALVQRAGHAVFVAAIHAMGGAYGKKVAVACGGGNNGADGRVAAAKLHQRGAAVAVFDITDSDQMAKYAQQRFDLWIDAGFGTGFRGSIDLPELITSRVLAVDIPSGLDGLTGVTSSMPWPAVKTVTFAALKPGLLLGEGPRFAGEIELADIGLCVGEKVAWNLLEERDVESWLAPRSAIAHKWSAPVAVVAGFDAMKGAAQLCASASLRAGAGHCLVFSPGGRLPVGEWISVACGLSSWAEKLVGLSGRVAVGVVGPGVGQEQPVREGVRRVLSDFAGTLVLDADALRAIGSFEDGTEILASRSGRTILTPHLGEFRALLGRAPSADLITEVSSYAKATCCVVLLKGPTTLVASPNGEVLLVAEGTPALATAGSGDVLAGVIGALLARGLSPLHAAAAGAFVHGRAGRIAGEVGTTAGDLIGCLRPALVQIGQR